ncbi:MAG: glyoxylate/hydroxypyruvate reductase A [Pseudomonadota bacterium]
MSARDILLAGDISAAERDAFLERLSDRMSDEPTDATRYAIVWKPDPDIFRNTPSLEVIFSLGAGVDHVLNTPNLPDVPVVRFVDPDLTGRMMEYVCLQCLLHLRRQRAYDSAQRNKTWNQIAMPTAREITVGIMGFGVLGQACGRALLALGFNVRGLARSTRKVEDIETFTTEQQAGFLAGTDMLVNLMPLSEETRNMIDADLISHLRSEGALGGPVIINAGRGGSLDECAVIEALENGTLAGVSLDVFQTEPLSADSPLWGFDNAIVTPHVAAITDPNALSNYVQRQIDAYENGKPMENVVDRSRGY